MNKTYKFSKYSSSGIAKNIFFDFRKQKIENPLVTLDENINAEKLYKIYFTKK